MARLERAGAHLIPRDPRRNDPTHAPGLRTDSKTLAFVLTSRPRDELLTLALRRIEARALRPPHACSHPRAAHDQVAIAGTAPTVSDLPQTSDARTDP